MYVKFIPRGYPARVDEDLLDSFDVAMKDTLDAGKPGPAETLSKQRLDEAYKDWKPLKFEDDNDPQDDRHVHMSVYARGDIPLR